MNIRTIFFLVATSISCYAAAQTPSAEEYFNRAARHYVKDDKLTALRTLDAGLRQYPGDARMLKLAEELLKENQQQQQQQQQQQEQRQQEQQQQEQRQEEQQAKEQESQERAAEEKERQQRSGQMTKEEAERMLDALEHKEQDVQQRVRTKLRPGRRAPIDKDW